MVVIKRKSLVAGNKNIALQPVIHILWFLKTRVFGKPSFADFVHRIKIGSIITGLLTRVFKMSKSKCFRKFNKTFTTLFVLNASKHLTSL